MRKFSTSTVMAAVAVGPAGLAVWNGYRAVGAEGAVQELLVELVIMDVFAVTLMLTLALVANCSCTRAPRGGAATPAEEREESKDAESPQD